MNLSIYLRNRSFYQMKFVNFYIWIFIVKSEVLTGPQLCHFHTVEYFQYHQNLQMSLDKPVKRWCLKFSSHVEEEHSYGLMIPPSVLCLSWKCLTYHTLSFMQVLHRYGGYVRVTQVRILDAQWACKGDTGTNIRC